MSCIQSHYDACFLCHRNQLRRNEFVLAADATPQGPKALCGSLPGAQATREAPKSYGKFIVGLTIRSAAGLRRVIKGLGPDHSQHLRLQMPVKDLKD